MNIQAFDRMAAIVGAFAKHMNNVSVPQPTVDGEFELIFRQMNNCTLMSDTGKLEGWLGVGEMLIILLFAIRFISRLLCPGTGLQPIAATTEFGQSSSGLLVTTRPTPRLSISPF